MRKTSNMLTALHLSSFFLLMAVMSCVQSSEYPCICDPCTRKDFACEKRDVLVIKCDRGYKIKIVDANYGRTEPDSDRCQFGSKHRDRTDCRAANSRQVLTQLCENKRICRVPANKETFGGDPCPGTYKYLEVDYQCQDADECSEGTHCLHGGVCTNTAGSFTCDCTGTGYTGGKCTDEVDECATGTPCSNGGVCINTAGSFSCDCTGTGYTGAKCTDALQCSADSCFNGGSCTHDGTYMWCTCPPGTAGDRCEIDTTDDCVGVDCGHCGSCIDCAGGYFCQCDASQSSDCQTFCTNTTVPEVCDPLDIVFIIDESGSIGGVDFTKVRTFFANIAEHLKPGTRVAAVTFDDSAYVAMDFTGKDLAKDKIMKLYYDGGETNIAAGINTARGVFARARSGVGKVAILFTDGESDENAAKSAAQSAASEDIRLICVGVGDGIVESFLKELSYKYFNFLRIQGFDNMLLSLWERYESCP